MAAPGQRPHQPGEIHPDGGGDGADPPAGPPRPGHRVPSGALDQGPAGRGPADQRQPLAAPVPGKRLSAQAAAALDAAGLPPDLLIFEITENVVMEDLAGAREIMRKLDQLGIRLAIDDFGTGHSSLAYLKQFPVQEVKVDRTFVQGMVENPVDSAIVRAVIDLADAMGIAAVAEGVETEGQLAGLRTLGCPIAQGFYFSQPLRAEEFDGLLTRHFACTSASG